MKNLLRFEPVLSAGFVQAALALLLTFGVHLTVGQTGAIEAAAAALLALFVAAAVRPFEPAALIGLLTAIGTLLIAFGVKHVTVAQVSAINAIVVIVMANILRVHVTPNTGSPVPVSPAAPPPAAQ